MANLTFRYVVEQEKTCWTCRMFIEGRILGMELEIAYAEAAMPSAAMHDADEAGRTALKQLLTPVVFEDVPF